MSEKKFGKRLLAWALTMVLTVSLLPLNALAEETEEDAPLTEVEVETPAVPAADENEDAAEPAEEEEIPALPEEEADEESEDAGFEETEETWDAYLAESNVPVTYGTYRTISLKAEKMENCSIAYVEGASLTKNSELKTQSSTGMINDTGSINGKYGIMIFAKPDDGYALSYMGAVTGSNFFSIADGGVDSDGNADVGSSQFFRDYTTQYGGKRLEDNGIIDSEDTAKAIVGNALAAGYHGTMFYSRPQDNGGNISDTIYFAAEKLPEFKKEIAAVKHGDADYVTFTDGMTVSEGDTILYRFTVTFDPAAYSFVKNGVTQYASVNYTNIVVSDPMLNGYEKTLKEYTSGAVGTEVSWTEEYEIKASDLVDEFGNDKQTLTNTATLEYHYKATYSEGTETRIGRAEASIPVRRDVSYRYASVDGTPLPEDFPAAPNGILKQPENTFVSAAPFNVDAEYYVEGGKWVLVSKDWEDKDNGIVVAPGSAFKMPSKAVTLTAYWEFIEEVTVTGSIDHGKVDVESQIIYAGENSREMVFTPAAGYAIVSVKVNGTELEEFARNTDGSYTYPAQKNVQNNIRVDVTTVKTIGSYTVQHYHEQLDGSYELHETQNFRSIAVGQVVTAVAKEYDGLTFHGSHVNNVCDGEVLADDSLVLKLYYKLNTYTVTYIDGVEDSEVFADRAYDNVKHGAATPAFDGTPTRNGYQFVGWDSEIAAIVTGNVTYTAQWQPNDTPVDPETPDNGGSTDNGGDNNGNGDNNGSGENPDNGDNNGNGGSTDNGGNTDNGDNSGGDNGGSEAPTTPTTPSRPSRPSRPSSSTDNTVTIEDDDALGLNTTDHFAYIVGYGNGEVRPQNNITRAEVATIFFRLLTDDVRDENLTKTNPYSDVAATAWYNTAVSTLSSMGIITGYPDGTFRPNAAITRAEFAAIAARFDPDGDKTAAAFSDIASHWAKDEISIAYNNGWINGYPDGTFGPQRDITRAETMTLVNRVLNRLPETEDDLLPNMTVWTDNANTKAWYYLAVQEATNSHYYEFKTNSQYEKWTELREMRDWSQLEK